MRNVKGETNRRAFTLFIQNPYSPFPSCRVDKRSASTFFTLNSGGCALLIHPCIIRSVGSHLDIPTNRSILPTDF